MYLRENAENASLIVGSSFVTLFLVWVYLIMFSEPKMVTDVKEGRSTLMCQMKDGWREIDSTKVVALDNSGYWIFTNGYAKNCTVK